MTRSVLALALALICAGAANAAAGNLDDAIAAYERFDFERALDLLASAGADPSLGNRERAHVDLYRGLVNATLGRWSQAETAFGEALASDPTLRLPPQTSPKIVARFDAARARIEAARPVPEPPVEVPTAPRARNSALRTASVVAVGLSAAALAGGATARLLAASRSDEARQAMWADDTRRLDQEAQVRVTWSNVLFGVGGGLAVAAVTMYVLSPRGADRSTVALIPQISTSTIGATFVFAP